MPIYLDAFYSKTGCFQKTIGCLHFVLKLFIFAMLYQPTKHIDYHITNSAGATSTLTYKDYDMFNSSDIYQDELGNLYETKDGGKSFSEITPYNNFDNNNRDKSKESWHN